MLFEEYCTSKKIDATLFKTNDIQLYTELEQLFSLVHPNSFTQQKLFLINNIRRKYQLPFVPKAEKAPKVETPKPASKPIENQEIKASISTETAYSQPKKPAFKPVIKPIIKKETDSNIEIIDTKISPTNEPKEEEAKALETPKKPVFKPVMKKAVSSESPVAENAAETTENKPIASAPKPIMKPIMKKAVSTETTENEVVSTSTPETETKPVEAPKKVIFKPVMKKREE